MKRLRLLIKPKDITKDIKNLTGSTLETNQGAQKTKEQLKADNELQNKKYAEVKQTIAKHKKEILADKDFIEYKKSPDQQKLLKNVPLAKRDAYLVTRYALQSAA